MKKMNEMKKIKLSTILLIGVFVVLIGILVWQAVFSKNMMRNREKLDSASSIDELYEYLAKSDHYCMHSIMNIDSMSINGLCVQIMKSNKTAMFVSNEIGIIGFDGDQLIFRNDVLETKLNTDLPNINILGVGSENSLYINTCNHKFFRDVTLRNIAVAAATGRVEIRDKSKELNLDLQMNAGHFYIELAPETHIGHLNIDGIIANTLNMRSADSVIEVKGDFACNSLHIDLVSPEPHKLHLPESLKERKDDIHVSDNIEIL